MLKVLILLLDQIQTYLTHEHLWVQLISCQLFGFLFANYTVDDFFESKESYLNFKTRNSFIKVFDCFFKLNICKILYTFFKPIKKLRDLIDSFCIQLKSPILDEKLAEQIVKNLAYMGKILNKYEHLENSDVISEIKHDINIEWLIKKVLKEAKYELVNKPKETIKVNYFFAKP